MRENILYKFKSRTFTVANASRYEFYAIDVSPSFESSHVSAKLSGFGRANFSGSCSSHRIIVAIVASRISPLAFFGRVKRANRFKWT